MILLCWHKNTEGPKTQERYAPRCYAPRCLVQAAKDQVRLEGVTKEATEEQCDAGQVDPGGSVFQADNKVYIKIESRSPLAEPGETYTLACSLDHVPVVIVLLEDKAYITNFSDQRVWMLRGYTATIILPVEDIPAYLEGLNVHLEAAMTHRRAYRLAVQRQTEHYEAPELEGLGRIRIPEA